MATTTTAIEIVIDTEGGVQRGTALIFCKADARLDGRYGQEGDGRVYFDSYDVDLYVIGRSRQEVLRKAARKLGHTTVTFKIESD